MTIPRIRNPFARARTHPDWCARDYQCTARFGSPAGEHRSTPLPWKQPWGRLVATRVQDVRGNDRLVIHATVPLDPHPARATAEARRITAAIDLAVRRALGLPLTTTVPDEPDLVRR